MRTKLLQSRVNAVAGKSGIATVIEPGRRIHENAAFDTLEESVVIEIVDVFHIRRQGRLPPQTIIQCQSRPYLPRVHRVDPKRKPFDMVKISSACDQLARFPKHKIRQSQTGCRTVESELMSAGVRSQSAFPALLDVDAERHLVVSANQAHIIVHTVQVSDVPVAGDKST